MSELERALSAYREELDAPAAEPERTRKRVLGGLARRRSRHHTMALTLVLSSFLVSGTSWAWSTGRLVEVERWVGGAAASAEVGETAERATPRPNRGAVADPPSLAVEPLVAPPTEAEPPPALPEANPPPPRAAALAAPATLPTPESAERAPAAPAGPTGTPASLASALAAAEPATAEAPTEASRFAAAHRLHFGGGDPVAAAAAWDDYLRAYPDGRLAPEARYNRALAWLRAGHEAEARRALTPFAEAPPGAFRREEARALLGRPTQE